MKLIFERDVGPQDVRHQDSGQSLTVEFDGDSAVFVRVQSWDDNKEHPVFETLIGRRVRVTVETL